MSDIKVTMPLNQVTFHEKTNSTKPLDRSLESEADFTQYADEVTDS